MVKKLHLEGPNMKTDKHSKLWLNQLKIPSLHSKAFVSSGENLCSFKPPLSHLEFLSVFILKDKGGLLAFSKDNNIEKEEHIPKPGTTLAEQLFS